MRILIVAATEKEIQPFLRKFQFPQLSQSRSLALKSHSVEILISGIGILHTAFALGKIFAGNKYDLAVQAGIGGSFDKKISPGEIVIVKKEYVSDLGAEDGKEFRDIFDLGLMKRNEPPYKNGLLVNSKIILTKSLRGIKRVNAITVNTVHGRRKTIKEIKRSVSASVESMEGAAFHYSCLQNEIPFTQLRAISNYVERRNKRKWKIPLAIKNLNQTLEQFVLELTKD
jgi:futalosine hydrolase